MNYDSRKHRRRSLRLKGYDYTQPGAYFVTICTYQWANLFGDVKSGVMIFDTFGQAVEEEWLRTAQIRPNVELDEYVIMPNHIHGIIMIEATDVGATWQVAPTNNTKRPRGPAPGSLGAIMAQFKRAATLRINHLRGTHGQPVWHRNYYEHIIRNDDTLNRIREYVHTNPQRWHLDKYNPAASHFDDFDKWLDKMK